MKALDLSKPMSIRAEMARAGLHDLSPYWSPDTDSMVDPLDDAETRADVRSFMVAMWRACLNAESAAPKPLGQTA